MMKKRSNAVAGFTLIEILIAVVISSIMMGAMFTSYSIVNSTYQQVTDKAKISQAGRDLVGQILREVRMAGYKYIGDDIPASNEHNPIKITKGKGFKKTNGCDKLEIVYGSIKYEKSKAEGDRFDFTRYKITYECKNSDIIDETIAGGATKIDGFAIYKSKELWDNDKNQWKDTSADSDDTTYKDEKVLDYVQDLVFVPFDEKGKMIGDTSKGPHPTDAKKYDVRTIDISLVVRSSKPFYRSDVKLDGDPREIKNITKDRTEIKEEDKYLRDTISVTANARNIGLE
jgi:prepilin-type N-terminal cleavage/methylation domain-containing protein